MVRFGTNLYQGNREDALKAAQSNDFKVIVYVGQSIPEALTHHSKVPVIHIPLYDGKTPLDRFYPILSNVGVQKTLLACQLGQSRSPSLVMLYYMYYHKMSFGDAYRLVQRKVPQFKPNPDLLDCVREFMSAKSTNKKTYIH